MKFKNFPIYRIEWVTSAFLIGTALLSLTVVPWFLWTQFTLADGAPNKVEGWGFVWALFVFYYYATGFGITLGYHRLFSHISFKAKWPVKLFVLLFGAASFENSAHDWCADHRIHHKHVDEDDDPYDISKGFFYAHIGWLLFRLKPPAPITNVKDLEADPLVMWQHRYVLQEDKELGDLTIVFCSDTYLLDLNRQHLDHDYFTDIITFDYSDFPVVSGDLFAEVTDRKEGTRLKAVVTTAGEFVGETFVLAAGAWSPAAADHLTIDNNFLTIDNLSRHCQCKHQEVGNDGGGELHNGGGNGKDLLLLIVE